MIRNRKYTHTLVCAAVMVLTSIVASDAAAGPAESKVFLNGKPVAVFFNDGDSFRVLNGRLKGAKARLAGFNTLESHGPVHQWGDWTHKELYVLAKMATLHARRGVWHCTSDGKTDTYGRMLAHCPGLAEELIRLGYAHALTVTDDPADAKYLAAQKEAQEAGRGIWAHGIPSFVVTSLHSVEEDLSGRGTYNRTVSTADGHSVMWRHTDKYRECQEVCKIEYTPGSDEQVTAVLSAFKADPAAAKVIEGLTDEQVERGVRDFMSFRHVDREIPEDRRWDMVQLLSGYEAAGKFGPMTSQKLSCMVHVDFKRRYGTGKAACLK